MCFLLLGAQIKNQFVDDSPQAIQITVTNDETGEDVFVHVTALRGLRINEGDAVSYEEEAGKKGTQAANIELI